MKKSKLNILLGILLLSVFAACKIKTPDNLIPQEKMEDILFDYHFSKAASNDINYKESYKKEAYKNYLYKKHGISEAEFDSSYAWYARNTTVMEEIYENIKNKVTERLEKVEEVLRLRENKFIRTVSADTAEIWGGAKYYIMKPLPNTSLISFSEETDTTFHLNDHIKFKANYRFENKNEHQKAITIISVIYKNDSIANFMKETTADGPDSIYFNLSEKREMHRLTLNIFLTNTYKDSGDSLTLIINDLKLMRYHSSKNRHVNQ